MTKKLETRRDASIQMDPPQIQYEEVKSVEIREVGISTTRQEKSNESNNVPDSSQYYDFEEDQGEQLLPTANSFTASPLETQMEQQFVHNLRSGVKNSKVPSLTTPKTTKKVSVTPLKLNIPPKPDKRFSPSPTERDSHLSTEKTLSPHDKRKKPPLPPKPKKVPQESISKAEVTPSTDTHESDSDIPQKPKKVPKESIPKAEVTPSIDTHESDSDIPPKPSRPIPPPPYPESETSPVNEQTPQLPTSLREKDSQKSSDKGKKQKTPKKVPESISKIMVMPSTDVHEQSPKPSRPIPPPPISPPPYSPPPYSRNEIPKLLSDIRTNFKPESIQTFPRYNPANQPIPKILLQHTKGESDSLLSVDNGSLSQSD